MKLFTTVFLSVFTLTISSAFAQCIAPAAPVTSNDTVLAPGATATLTAIGDSIRWYNVPSGGAIVATGNTFTTPFISATTIYYASDMSIGGGDSVHGGKLYHTGSQFPANNNQNARMIFNVNDSSILVSVKVYTDFPGDRVIKLYDASNTLLESDTIYVQADSAVLDLNYLLAPGNGYYLTTDSAVNQQIPNNNNYTGPRLRRNSSNVNYPYNVDTLASITGNDQGTSALYFYFYDWIFQTPFTECESERTAAEVFYDNSIGVSDVAWSDITLFPNPANNIFYVNRESNSGTALLNVYDVTGRNVLQTELINQTQAIDASELANGLYSVKMRTDNNEQIIKLIIQR